MKRSVVRPQVLFWIHDQCKDLPRQVSVSSCVSREWGLGTALPAGSLEDNPQVHVRSKWGFSQPSDLGQFPRACLVLSAWCGFPAEKYLSNLLELPEAQLADCGCRGRMTDFQHPSRCRVVKILVGQEGEHPLRGPLEPGNYIARKSLRGVEPRKIGMKAFPGELLKSGRDFRPPPRGGHFDGFGSVLGPGRWIRTQVTGLRRRGRTSCLSPVHKGDASWGALRQTGDRGRRARVPLLSWRSGPQTPMAAAALRDPPQVNVRPSGPHRPLPPDTRASSAGRLLACLRPGPRGPGGGGGRGRCDGAGTGPQAERRIHIKAGGRSEAGRFGKHGVRRVAPGPAERLFVRSEGSGGYEGIGWRYGRVLYTWSPASVTFVVPQVLKVGKALRDPTQGGRGHSQEHEGLSLGLGSIRGLNGAGSRVSVRCSLDALCQVDEGVTLGNDGIRVSRVMCSRPLVPAVRELRVKHQPRFGCDLELPCLARGMGLRGQAQSLHGISVSCLLLLRAEHSD
ncbi:hypothetical protein Cadr_000012369 [Camelus dromedarius]|uniref:Uncharacterized protein n=1 Tax=Camelus dromedarius TaxID=9838 RepID=A0A5N4DTP4_CAMDR|nr:hypothetical protein Cadr_000012369 [Camelus dromedarius]